MRGFLVALLPFSCAVGAYARGRGGMGIPNIPTELIPPTAQEGPLTAVPTTPIAPLAEPLPPAAENLARAPQAVALFDGHGIDRLLREQGVENLPETPYVKLEKLFEAAQGKLPSKEHLLGWHAGRLFNGNSQTEPRPILLSAIEKKPDGGPLLGKSLRIAQASPQLDDLGRLSPQEEERLKSQLEQDAYQTNTALFGATGVQYNRSDKGVWLTWGWGIQSAYSELRAIGDLILQKVFLVAEPNYLPPNQTLYAYYYAKIREALPTLPPGELKDKRAADLRAYLEKEISSDKVEVSVGEDYHTHAPELLFVTFKDTPILEQALLESVDAALKGASREPKLSWVGQLPWRISHWDAEGVDQVFENTIPNAFRLVKSEEKIAKAQGIKYGATLKLYVRLDVPGRWYWVGDRPRDAVVAALREHDWKLYTKSNAVIPSAGSYDYAVVTEKDVP